MVGLPTFRTFVIVVVSAFADDLVSILSTGGRGCFLRAQVLVVRVDVLMELMLMVLVLVELVLVELVLVELVLATEGALTGASIVCVPLDAITGGLWEGWRHA